MNKKMFIISILIIFTILILFLFPKYCGNFAGVIDEGQVFIDCKCIGIKYYNPTGAPAFFGLGRPYTKYCIGLPVRNSCTKVQFVDGELKGVPTICNTK